MNRYINEKPPEKTQLIIGSVVILNYYMQSDDKSIKICFRNNKIKNALLLPSIIYRIDTTSTSRGLSQRSLSTGHRSLDIVHNLILQNICKLLKHLEPNT